MDGMIHWLTEATENNKDVPSLFVTKTMPWDIIHIPAGYLIMEKACAPLVGLRAISHQFNPVLGRLPLPNLPAIPNPSRHSDSMYNLGIGVGICPNMISVSYEF